MMIRLMAQYGHGPVHLLGEEQAYHLVAESHLRQGYLTVGTRIHGRREPYGPPTTNMSLSGRKPSCRSGMLENSIEVYSLPRSSSRTTKIRWLHRTEKHLSLTFFLLVLAHVLRVLDIREHPYRVWHVMPQPFQIHLGGRLKRGRGIFPYDKQLDFHIFH